MRRLLALFAVMTLAGCDAVLPEPSPPGPVDPVGVHGCPSSDETPQRLDGELSILAGSELKDLGEVRDSTGRSIVDYVREETGVSLTFTYSGTLDAVSQVIDGEAAKLYDAVWLPNNLYLDLYLDANPRAGLLGPPTDIMRSPVIVGVRPERAGQLTSNPSWERFAQLAGGGQLGFAMTNPAASNSGFSALLAIATALSGAAPGPVDANDINTVTSPLQRLFLGQQLTAGSSGWLKDAYVRRTQDANPVDALINYESVLLSVGDLTLVYPSEGVVTANYPLTPILGDDAAMRRFEAVVDSLCGRAMQERLMTMTHRRPTRGDVELPATFAPTTEIVAPERLSVADSLIDAFGNTIRRPARTIYVLDLSGSMETPDAVDPTDPTAPPVTRLEALQKALLSLTGAGDSLPAQFAVFHEREQVILLTFSTTPNAPQRFEVPAGDPGATMAQIADSVGRMQARGDTALYDALVEAYRIAAEPTAEERYTTIALLSDGQRTQGRYLADFRAYYNQLPPEQRSVPVFSVLFGDGDRAELTALSRDITGGEFFDGNAEHTLAEVFQDIRGYQ